MKLTHPILFVMLDGKEHSEEEIIARVRHFVPPNRAARMLAGRIESVRLVSRSRGHTGRVIESRRLPMPTPEDINMDQAIAYVIGRTLAEMSRAKPRPGRATWLIRTEKGYILAEGARAAVRSSQVAGGVAAAIKQNLMAKGEFI